MTADLREKDQHILKSTSMKQQENPADFSSVHKMQAFFAQICCHITPCISRLTVSFGYFFRWQAPFTKGTHYSFSSAPSHNPPKLYAHDSSDEKATESKMNFKTNFVTALEFFVPPGFMCMAQLYYCSDSGHTIEI